MANKNPIPDRFGTPAAWRSARLSDRSSSNGHFHTPLESGGVFSRWTLVLWMLVWWVSVLPSTGTVHAQEEDEEARPPALVGPRFEIAENQFDAWVFENIPSVKGAESKLDKLLVLQVEGVDAACGLSDLQKKKLMLAGRGDVKRFFEKVEVVRKKFNLVRKDQAKFNQIWEDIRPLQTTFQSGLFDEDSLFRKTVRNTLTPEQLERYSELERDRDEFRFRTKVELGVAIMEGSLPLRAEQREKLIALVMQEGRRTRSSSGTWDYYVVLWTLSKIPEEKMKPLFDDAQWRVMTAQLNQGRGLEQTLKLNGVLFLDEEKK